MRGYRKMIQFGSRLASKMLLVFLVFVPPLLVPVDSQAPGDGAPECKDLSRYASHQQKLLDSWDYVQLLPQVSDETGGVWQTLDVDGNSDGDSWRASSIVQCKEQTSVCGRSNTSSQENWMITQHISHPYNVTTVQVMVASKLDTDTQCNPSTPYCVEDLSLYVWETSTQDNISAADTRNYRFVSNVSSGEVTIELSGLNQAGFYLGIRDNGTCVSVSRVLVYYSVCRAGAVGLVRVDQERVSGDSVQGHCAENSVPNTPPQLQCLQSGEWKASNNCPNDTLQCRGHTKPCVCVPGYQEEPVNGALVCSECPVGMFSEGGGSRCRQCPVNSNTTQPGMRVCPCLNGYYRPLGSDYSDSDCITPSGTKESFGTGLSEVVGITFGVLCGVLLMGISFVLGLFLGKHLQKHKHRRYKNTTSLYDSINLNNSKREAPCLVPPPLPGERSNRSSREDIRSQAEPVAAPEYAVPEQRTTKRNESKSGWNCASVTAAQSEPEYEVCSSGVDHKQQNSKTEKSCALPVYAVLEERTSDTDGRVKPPIPEIFITTEDGSGNSTKLEH